MKVIRAICWLIISLIPSLGIADNNCFMLVDADSGKVIKKEGQCETPSSPCSTFKIALSLMGYDDKILVDSAQPEWPYKPEFNADLELWKKPHTPTAWIQNSCIWYSQELTRKLGKIKFKNYVRKLNYGNQDVSGDFGKNNGLTNAWLSSSLQITPVEQINFLRKLIRNELPVSIDAQLRTRDLLFVENLDNGWRLYGKTGTGYQSDLKGSRYIKKPIGWFVGWIAKEKTTLIFVRRILEAKTTEGFAGKRAKDQLKELLKTGGFLN